MFLCKMQNGVFWGKPKMFFILLTVMLAVNIIGIMAAKPPLNIFINNVFDNIFEKYCGPDDVCVKALQCNSGKINEDGTKIIRPRIGEETRVQGSQYDNCSHYLEVCCNLADKTKSQRIIIPAQQQQLGCGFRNDKGVFLRISDADKTVAEFSEFPWMMAIMKDEKYLCGGALITHSVVITVAHYVHNEKAYSLLVRGGEWDTQTINEPFSHEDRVVTRIVVHEKFHDEDENLFYDIALLFLDRPFQLKPNIQTICLPELDTNFDNSKCFVTGWGKDKFGHEGQQQVILKKIEISVIPHDKCQGQFRATPALGRYFNLHETFICAGGEEGKDACEGDGGSPLVCPIPGHPSRYQLAGLVAWGIECGLPDVPGAYVNVAGLRSWINFNLIISGFDIFLLDNLNSEKSDIAVENVDQNISLNEANRDKRQYDNGCAKNEVCVRYYQCMNGKVNRDGRSLIRERIGGDQNNETVIDKCDHYMDTCCSLDDYHKVQQNKELVAAFEVPDGCGLRNNKVIINVNKTAENLTRFAEFPWMVAILSGEHFVCSGVLLSASVVLTLGSCVFNYEPRDLITRAGEWDTQTIKEPVPHEIRRVNKIIEHDDYSPISPISPDIALLFLKRPFELKTHINPICLPQARDLNISNTECIMTGWGKFNRPDADINILKKSIWKISRDSKICTIFNCTIAKFVTDDSNTGCNDADIGSPLVCKIINTDNEDRYQLIGVMSTCTPGNVGQQTTAVVSYIPVFRTWLREKIGGWFNGTLVVDIRARVG